MARYFREIGKQFSGDKTLAAKYMGVARNLLGGLKEMSGQVFQNARHVTLPDGAKITVWFAGEIARVWIDVREAVLRVEEALRCPGLISGLLAPEAVSVSSEIVGGVTVEHRALQWLYTAEYFRELQGISDSRIAVEAFAKEGFITNGFGPEPIAATYWSVFASAYSGAMRQAIQLMLGMGLELTKSFSSFGGVYYYNYGYAGTHGLVRKAGYTEEEPAFWLVRMPEDGYGVLAIDFPVCTDVTSAQIAQGVTWIPAGRIEFPTDIPEAISQGVVHELISAADFDTVIDGYEPLFPDCGWAFSISGHECQNVLTKTVELSALSDYRVYTQRFKLVFLTEEVEGLETISATMTSMGEELFFGPKRHLPRMPISGGVKASLYPHYDAYQAPHPTHTGSISCDVYVFYSGDDAQVFRFLWDRSKESTSGWLEGNFWNAEQVASGPYVSAEEGFYYGASHYVDSSACSYLLNGAVIASKVWDGSGIEYYYDLVPTDNGSGPYVRTAGGDVFQYHATIERKHSVIQSFSSRDSYALLMVPFHQREMAYVLDGSKTVTVDGSVVESSFKANVFKGTYWATSLSYDDSCTPDPGTTGPYLTVTDTVNNPLVTILPLVYPTLPAAYRYTNDSFLGGTGYNTYSGCVDSANNSIGGTYGTAEEIPGGTTYRGSLRAYSSGGVISVPITSEVQERIIDTTYITDPLDSMVLFGWSDGIKPDKYIVFTDINTVAGADTITNTQYDMSGVNTWAKSFVGIAN